MYLLLAMVSVLHFDRHVVVVQYFDKRLLQPCTEHATDGLRFEPSYPHPRPVASCFA